MVGSIHKKEILSMFSFNLLHCSVNLLILIGGVSGVISDDFVRRYQLHLAEATKG